MILIFLVVEKLQTPKPNSCTRVHQVVFQDCNKIKHHNPFSQALKPVKPHTWVAYAHTCLLNAHCSYFH